MLCYSSVRMRGIISCLSVSLFGESLAIDDFPERKDLIGIGLSDWETYASKLAEKFSYTNTYYHKEPMLDITNIRAGDAVDGREGVCDFLVSTDVFEHVTPPVSRAFENAYKMLKPGGVFVFSVPYSLRQETTEHFPELFDWRVEKEKEKGWVLYNKTRDGETQEFSDLVFHGGEGETLEMRVFCKDHLLEELSGAGFTEVKIHSEPCFEHGIYWPQGWSLPITAKK